MQAISIKQGIADIDLTAKINKEIIPSTLGAHALSSCGTISWCKNG